MMTESTRLLPLASRRHACFYNDFIVATFGTINLLGYLEQDLKDFARQSGLDVVYSETGRDSGRGYDYQYFLFEAFG